MADLPGVGSHLKDHVAVTTNYMDKSKLALSYLKPVGLVQNLQAISAMVQYKLTGRGPLASNVSSSG